MTSAGHESSLQCTFPTDEAVTIVEQIASNQERCLQVLFFLDTLIEQSEAVDSTEDAKAH